MRLYPGLKDKFYRLFSIYKVAGPRNYMLDLSKSIASIYNMVYIGKLRKYYPSVNS